MGITLQRTRLGCHLPRSLLWIYSRCLILRRMLRQWMGRALLALRRGYSNLGYRTDRRLDPDGSLLVIYLSASFFPLHPVFYLALHFIRIRRVCRSKSLHTSFRVLVFILPLYILYNTFGSLGAASILPCPVVRAPPRTPRALRIHNTAYHCVLQNVAVNVT